MDAGEHDCDPKSRAGRMRRGHHNVAAARRTLGLFAAIVDGGLDLAGYVD
jgi:hypothetical protein